MASKLALISFLVNVVFLIFYIFTLSKISGLYSELGAEAPDVLPQLLIGLLFVFLSVLSFLNWRKQKSESTNYGYLISLALLLAPILIGIVLFAPTIMLGPRSY